MESAASQPALDPSGPFGDALRAAPVGAEHSEGSEGLEGLLSGAGLRGLGDGSPGRDGALADRGQRLLRCGVADVYADPDAAPSRTAPR